MLNFYFGLIAKENILRPIDPQYKVEAQKIQMKHDVITQRMKDVLKQRDLTPYINSKNDFELIITGIDTEIHKADNTLCYGVYAKITQGSKSYLVHFLLKLEGNQASVDYLYIGDALISTQLYFDITFQISMILSFRYPDQTVDNLMIKKISGDPGSVLNHEWTVISKGKELHKLQIVLIPDGKGGTHFNIKG